jgi:ribosomal protein S17
VHTVEGVSRENIVTSRTLSKSGNNPGNQLGGEETRPLSKTAAVVVVVC